MIHQQACISNPCIGHTAKEMPPCAIIQQCIVCFVKHCLEQWFSREDTSSPQLLPLLITADTRALGSLWWSVTFMFFAGFWMGDGKDRVLCLWGKFSFSLSHEEASCLTWMRALTTDMLIFPPWHSGILFIWTRAILNNFVSHHVSLGASYF